MVLRIRILALAFLIATFGLIVRLFFWQIVKGEDLSLQARLQHTSSQEVFAQRGSILAADGSWLSASTDAWLLYGSKPEIDQTHRAIANTLAPLLIEAKANKKELLDETMRIEGLLDRQDALWVPIKHKLSVDL